MYTVLVLVCDENVQSVWKDGAFKRLIVHVGSGSRTGEDNLGHISTRPSAEKWTYATAKSAARATDFIVDSE